MPEPQAVPSTWRIVRTYLTQRECASHKDLYRAIKVHRPLLSNSQYHNKMSQFELNGLIAHKSRAMIKLTQKGREYVVDPNEKLGLPAWVPPAAIKTDAIVEVTKVRSNHSKEHMDKMRAARAAKKAAKPTMKKERKGGRGEAKPAMITIAGVPTKVDHELIEKLLADPRKAETKQDQTIDLPIGIRLKISVEVV